MLNDDNDGLESTEGTGKDGVGGMKNQKPLMRKAYGSIPHLPGSKFGNRDDKGLPEGEVKFLTKEPPKGSLVIVSEKLDGSCVGVIKKEGQLITINRAGYPCISSPWTQQRYFDYWVMNKKYNEFNDILNEREWIVGEWLLQAHGTLYDLTKCGPFAVFDLFKPGQKGGRVLYQELYERIKNTSIPIVPVLWNSVYPCPISVAENFLGRYGKFGARELAEGEVWRLEKEGSCCIIAKFVRPEKNPGCYLEGQTGKEAIWNMNLTEIAP